MVRKARPPLVEQDQSERAGKTVVEVAPVVVLPPVNEVRHVIGDVHEIYLAGTDHLIGDRHASITDVTDLTHEADCRASPLDYPRVVLISEARPSRTHKEMRGRLAFYANRLQPGSGVVGHAPPRRDRPRLGRLRDQRNGLLDMGV